MTSEGRTPSVKAAWWCIEPYCEHTITPDSARCACHQPVEGRGLSPDEHHPKCLTLVGPDDLRDACDCRTLRMLGVAEGRTPTPDECVQEDGCCLTHSPCFDWIGAALEGVEVPKGVCQGWPCPVTTPARTPSDG